MSKTKLLLRSLGVGYVSLAVNMAYSFLSIPLALKYLGKTEYGLWALVLSITSYLNFSELGMTNSVARHLIDSKNCRPDRQYGAIFLTGAVTFGVIALICLIIGEAGVHFIAPFFRISAAFQGRFEWLLMGSVALFSLSLVTRILSIPLYVYQRNDLSEFCNIVLYLIWFAVLWAGLHAGLGVYSLLLSQGVGFLWTCGFNIAVCARLSLYPSWNEWSRPSKEIIREIAIYSRDSFLQQLGQQIVMTLPMLMISRCLGLDAAAIWAVATRPFMILTQILCRPFQYGITMFSELFAMGEIKKMIYRWQQLSTIMTASVLVFVPIVAIYNAALLRNWTNGKIHWDKSNDIIFSLYILYQLLFHPWYCLVNIDKKFGLTRYTSLIEPIVLISIIYITIPLFGISGVAIGLLLSSIIVQPLPFLYRLKQIFGNDLWNISKNQMLRFVIVFPFIILSVYLPCIFINILNGWYNFISSFLISLVLSGITVTAFGVGKKNLYKIYKKK